MTNPELLRAYFRWSSRKIAEQVDAGLHDLRWIGNNFAEFLVSWLDSMDPPEKKDFLLALQSRRLQNSFKDDFPDELRHLSESVDWAQYETAARRYLMPELMVAEKRVLRAHARRGRKVGKEILRRKKAEGVAVERERRGVWSADRRIADRGTLQLDWIADMRGLEYTCHLRVDGESQPVLRDSFLGRYGITSRTTFTDFRDRSASEIADFVEKDADEFADFAAACLSGGYV